MRGEPEDEHGAEQDGKQRAPAGKLILGKCKSAKRAEKQRQQREAVEMKKVNYEELRWNLGK